MDERERGRGLIAESDEMYDEETWLLQPVLLLLSLVVELQVKLLTIDSNDWL